MAKEIKKDKREDRFAATPPIEALRSLISFATIRGIGYHASRRSSMELDFIDVKRAYFNAKVNRDIYVELPPEDAEPGMCAKLDKAMYGTRDAAQQWEIEYLEFMQSLGFVRGKSTPFVFVHHDRMMHAVVHGDDFTTGGPKMELDGFKQELEKKYELKVSCRLGAAPGDDKEGRVLNRIVRWTDGGLTYEADPGSTKSSFQSSAWRGHVLCQQRWSK